MRTTAGSTAISVKATRRALRLWFWRIVGVALLCLIVVNAVSGLVVRFELHAIFAWLSVAVSLYLTGLAAACGLSYFAHGRATKVMRESPWIAHRGVIRPLYLGPILFKVVAIVEPQDSHRSDRDLAVELAGGELPVASPDVRTLRPLFFARRLVRANPTTLWVAELNGRSVISTDGGALPCLASAVANEKSRASLYALVTVQHAEGEHAEGEHADGPRGDQQRGDSSGREDR